MSHLCAGADPVCPSALGPEAAAENGLLSYRSWHDLPSAVPLGPDRLSLLLREHSALAGMGPSCLPRCPAPTGPTPVRVLFSPEQCRTAHFKLLIWEQASVLLNICFYVYSHVLASFPNCEDQDCLRF